ncbi:TetR/AcrR family transcriptional regulator [Vagococcus jeotgali]|uniref:TetR/AcrR family transcriptional regulator n=1 Tax=Vagococcus jeotgali TaxID=3109030 RepID=UPI002DDC6FBE|nr:TetR/AcrR family transcriptional regulator [Vagococcus sp. B2T-5]
MGKIDPRVIKTRKKLRQAFLDLLKTRSLSEMNIKDLTNRAGVTRGTFYLHYRDKDTFIETIMEEIIEDFYNDVVIYKAYDEDEDKKIPQIVLDRVFSYIGQSPEFFVTLLKENDAEKYRLLFSDRLYDYLLEHVNYGNSIPVRKMPKELINNFIAYSLLGISDAWVVEGQIYANHYIATMVAKMYRSDLFEEVGLSDFFVSESA